MPVDSVSYQPIINLRNLPESINKQKIRFEQYAKDSGLCRLSISRAESSKYLPEEDCYTVLSSVQGKIILTGCDVVIVSKSEQAESILDKITNSVIKATGQAYEKLGKEELLIKKSSFPEKIKKISRK